MTDKQIIRLIDNKIKEKEITLQDMIGGEYIDPKKKIGEFYGNPKTSRVNKFESESWSDRFLELICEEEYNPYTEYYNLRIPIQDLIRFWWENCISKEAMLELIFEDIFCYFKDKMFPEKEETGIDLSIKTTGFTLHGEDLKASNLL